MKNTRTFRLVLCAFFTALTAVAAQIAIPIGPVPISLCTCAVFLSGALLGPKLGAVSQAVYVLLGAVGVPVFAMLKGGLSVLSGPTGGYIAGYILAAWLVGFLTQRRKPSFSIFLLAMLAGFFAYMIPGTCWYMFVTHSGLVSAFMVCVAPFLLGDALKMLLAAALAYRLKPLLQIDSDAVPKM